MRIEPLNPYADTSTSSKLKPKRNYGSKFVTKIAANVITTYGGINMLPTAVPETHRPFAKARRLLKYWEVMIIPGVVANPAPSPCKIKNNVT